MVTEKKWRVLHARKGSEVRVCNQLKKIHLDYYCPFIRRNKNKIKSWMGAGKIYSLLPEYVFVKCNEDDYNKIEAIPDVHNFFYWLGRKVEVDEKEINLLKEAVNLENDYLPERWNDEKRDGHLFQKKVYYSSSEITDNKNDGSIHLPSLRIKLIKKSDEYLENENMSEEKMYSKYYSWL